MDSKVNLVFRRKTSKKPLTIEQLAMIACEVAWGDASRYPDFLRDMPDRISGDHCRCEGPGEFVLMSRVRVGTKQYMRCRICGCMSHL